MKMMTRWAVVCCVFAAIAAFADDAPRDRRFRSVADALPHAAEARYLDLSFQQLSRVPATIGRLTSLESLNLSGNRLQQLPPEIAQLQHLRWLNVSGNQLRRLSDAVTELPELSQLIASDNRLTALPESMGRLSSLVMLSVGNNQLTDFPMSLADCQHLQTVLAVGNPISIPTQQQWRGRLPRTEWRFTAPGRP